MMNAFERFAAIVYYYNCNRRWAKLIEYEMTLQYFWILFLFLTLPLIVLATRDMKPVDDIIYYIYIALSFAVTLCLAVYMPKRKLDVYSQYLTEWQKSHAIYISWGVLLLLMLFSLIAGVCFCS